MDDALTAIQALLGEPPFLYDKDGEGGKKADDAVTTVITKNVVLADGTYATVTHTETTGGHKADDAVPHLRKLICGGDVLLGTVVGVCLTKMALKSSGRGKDLKVGNKFVIAALLVCAGVGSLAQNRKGLRLGVNADCIDRLSQCCRILLDPKVRAKLEKAFLASCKAAFSAMIKTQRAAKIKASEAEKIMVASQADDLIQFRQLRSQAVQGGIEVDLMDADDISRALGVDGHADASKLNHVYQLTGYSDPVYAEASVTVHDYDIVIDMLVINRTPNTLTNLTVELATMGDLKLVERPQSYTIGPLDERRLRANIKISSTETGHIFGTIVFDNSSTAQKTYVNMNDIQLDIMDYIRPAECKSEDFRAMWAEFEWENKVAINTTINDLKEFLDHIVTSTNMTCLGDSDAVRINCI
jgi:coatomer subunit beta